MDEIIKYIANKIFLAESNLKWYKLELRTCGSEYIPYCKEKILEVRRQLKEYKIALKILKKEFKNQ